MKIGSKYTGIIALAALLLSSLVPGVTLYADEVVPETVMPVYKPPLRGAPLARMGGGTRGTGDDAPVVTVLTPEHMGLTSQSQPVLYWYLSRVAPAARYEFVLIAEDDYDPLVETALQGINSAGIQRIKLADHAVSLKPGVSYQWSVAVIMDSTQRSSNILSSGMIEYIEPAEGIMTRVENAAGDERIGQYAGAGLWYDALQSLDEMIASNPGDAARLQKMRASLLSQVGLDAVVSATGR